MKPIDITCPSCGRKIGVLSIRRIRKIVRLLIKRIDDLPQFDREKLDLELDRMEAEAETEERALMEKIERERREWLDEKHKQEENEEDDHTEDLEDET
jgi:hypothetical protein